MPLLNRPTAFNDPDWIFELKYDGFRSLAVIEHGRAHCFPAMGIRSLRSLHWQNQSLIPCHHKLRDSRRQV
jgi:YD repeat-containing protein